LRAKTKSLSLVAAGLLVLAGCESQNGPSGPLNRQEEQGHRVFQVACAQCHDPYSARPRAGPGLRDLFRKRYLPSGAPANDERVRATILNGRVNMPAFRNILDQPELDDLLAFLHTL
jgi:mono/diheme cytochrome c family protein